VAQTRMVAAAIARGSAGRSRAIEEGRAERGSTSVRAPALSPVSPPPVERWSPRMMATMRPDLGKCSSVTRITFFEENRLYGTDN